MTFAMDRYPPAGRWTVDPANGMYQPFGTFDIEIDTVEPWPLRVPVSKLTPRLST